MTETFGVCESCGKALIRRHSDHMFPKRFCSPSCYKIFQGRSTRPDLMPVVHPSIRDIAWAAGLYEGEGTAIRIDGLKVSVTQKDRWILDQLKQKFGGTVGQIRSMEPYVAYAWSIHGALARGFLMTIFSFLSPWRRVQAVNVLRGKVPARAGRMKGLQEVA